MAKEQRKIISAVVEEISPYNFDTNLQSIREQIDKLIAKYGQDARLDWDPNFYYDYDQNPSPLYVLKVQRIENDAEFERRIEQEKKWQDERQERDRIEFERLNKLFGKK